MNEAGPVFPDQSAHADFPSAAKLGMASDAVTVAVHRLRGRLLESRDRTSTRAFASWLTPQARA